MVTLIQLIADRTSVIPTVQLYDEARAHISKGLSPGGVRLLWDQFPTGRFPPLPYLAFKQVFGFGWKKYDPWQPPSCLLKHKQAKASKTKSLTYAYAEENKVKSFNQHIV